MTKIQADQQLDTSGLPCPLPLLKAKQALASMRVGQVLAVTATDAGSWRDFASFGELSQHELLDRSEQAGVYFYWLRKGESR